MADREKIITALEQVKDEINPVSGSRKARLRDAVDDAIALLKEQPEIVRCEDCKERGTYQCPIYVGGDGMCGRPDDWYCGDGERW